MVGSTPNYYVPKPEYRDGYNKGFEDAVALFESKVRKLGKKYHVEFLEDVKEMRDGRYVTATTAHNHKCNCKYCKLNNK